MNKTKKLLCDSFKKLMRTVPFDKISISDITNESNLKRQTFYYHFLDKYELINYIYYYDIFLPMTDNLDNTVASLEVALTLMFIKLQSESYLYKNAFQMNAGYGFKEYLFSIMHSFMITINEGKVSDIEAKIYTHGIVGIIIDWVLGEIDATPQLLASILVKEIKKPS